MLRVRVIPVLLIRGSGLVKTVRFSDARYLGDPLNIVKIFNDKEVDELVVLDIEATREQREPNYKLIEEITSECFMPLCYGGGIRTLDQVRRLLSLGVEKVALNSVVFDNPQFVREASASVGSQSVVVSIDVKRTFWGKNQVFTNAGTLNTKRSPEEVAQEMEALGAGEILLNSIDHDGLMTGYDLELIQRVSHAVSVPVIACGGAGTVEHLGQAVKQGHASAVAAGSMFVFHGKHRAVLVNVPPPAEVQAIFQ